MVNILNSDLVATGQDQTVKVILRLMKGDSLERLNRVRTAQITGDNAVNERAQSTSVLTNSFMTLFTKMLDMHTLGANESPEFLLLGKPVSLVKGADNKMSVLVGKGDMQAKLTLCESFFL